MILSLVLPPALLAGAAALWRLYRSHALGAFLVVLAYLAAALATQPVYFQLGGLNVYLEDLLGACLFGTALLRFVFQLPARKPPLGLTLFCLAAFMAFVTGGLAYGLKPAGVEYRSYFYLSAAALYCASFPIGSRQLASLISIWLGGAGALLILAACRWSAAILQLSIASTWADVGGGNPFRVLNASQTFYLAEALVMLLYLWRQSSKRWTLACLIGLLAGVIILLQHRSVWVAAAAACAAMAWRERMFRKFVAAGSALALLGTLTAWILPEKTAKTSAVAESLETSVAEPFDMQKSTFGWRIGMWQAYLLEFATASVQQKLLGMGLGNPGVYAIDNTESRASAHNYFVFTLNRTGVLGLAALIGAYAAIFRRLKGSGGSWDYLGLLFAITIGQLVYFTVYTPSYDQGLLVGAAFGVLTRRPNGSAG